MCLVGLGLGLSKHGYGKMAPKKAYVLVQGSLYDYMHRILRINPSVVIYSPRFGLPSIDSL